MKAKKRLARKTYSIRIIYEAFLNHNLFFYREPRKPLFGPKSDGTTTMGEARVSKNKRVHSIKKARYLLQWEHVCTIASIGNSTPSEYAVDRRRMRPIIHISLLFDDGTKVELIRRGEYRPHKSALIYAIDDTHKSNKQFWGYRLAPGTSMRPTAVEVIKRHT